MQVLHIPDGEELPATNDARVRHANVTVDDTSLILFLVAASPPEVTFRPFGEALFHDTRSTAR